MTYAQRIATALRTLAAKVGAIADRFDPPRSSLAPSPKRSGGTAEE